jgi:hypothetical protein
MIYNGRISPTRFCVVVVVIVGFQGTVFGWDGVANDFGLGRTTFTLVVFPLNALIFSVSLAQGAEVEGFKNML